MIKGCWLPGRGAVADFASLRVAACHVIRILRARVIVQVAGNACCHRDVVVVVDVAERAWRRRVRACQRETRRRVIKLGVRPEGSVVTLFARGREAAMIHRRFRRVVVRLVARDAGRDRDVVVIVDVAGCARSRRVFARQRECRLGVVECRRLPSGSGMAELASLAKTASHVIGILRAIEIIDVARHAGGNRDLIVVINVAQRARRRSMRPSQRKGCLRVIKRRRNPPYNRVAILTGLREAPRHVVGVFSADEILRMAGIAGSRTQVVIVIDMALLAGHWWRGVSTREQKTRSRVVELRVQPVVGGVAAFARCQEGSAACHVIWIRRPLEIRLVAGHAVRRHRLELAVARILVAGIAIHRSVRACQWEAVVVILNIFDRNVPTAHRVALFAIRSQLALVDVRVAILALVAHVREHWLDMAGNASNAHVHTAQGILRLIVVEFWNGANRLPTRGRMAVLAGYIEAAVRTLGRGNTGRLTAH